MNAEYIAKSLEAITVTQGGETSKPLQEFANFVRQQQAEIEVLNEMLACEGVEAGREYLDYRIAEILKANQ